MDYISHLLLNCGIFIILAVSLNLINGIAGQLSLGHAGLFAVGAYAAAVYSVYFPLPLPNFMNLFISCFIAMTAAGLMGLLIGVPCLRLKGDYLAIATLGFGEIIRILIMSSDYLGGARGFTDIPHWSNLFYVYVGVIITIVFNLNLVRSSLGRAMIAIREDEIAAESMGVYAFKYKLMAFVLGAIFAGLAGGLYAHAQQFLHPNGFTFMQSVLILLMLILGGLGSISGSILGAIILTILPEILRFMGETVSEYRVAIYAVLLVILMILRPRGIMGKKEIRLSFWKK